MNESYRVYLQIVYISVTKNMILNSAKAFFRVNAILNKVVYIIRIEQSFIFQLTTPFLTFFETLNPSQTEKYIDNGAS